MMIDCARQPMATATERAQGWAQTGNAAEIQKAEMAASR